MHASTLKDIVKDLHPSEQVMVKLTWIGFNGEKEHMLLNPEGFTFEENAIEAFLPDYAAKLMRGGVDAPKKD